jgi:nicotinate-nucleotide adenylyltransferase
MTSPPERVGLLGGTFDPPTTAHVSVATTALDALNFDEVWLMPAGDPWQKGPATSAQHRLMMCRLAVEHIPCVSVCDIETTAPGPTYSVCTLQVLTARFPAIRFTFIIGDDVDLSTWRDPIECRRLVDFVRVARLGRLYDDGIPTVDFGVTQGSSTAARSHLCRGRRSSLVAPAVADYISEQGLYRSAAA